MNRFNPTTIAKMRRYVTEGVHIEDRKLREKIKARSSTEIDSIDSIVFNLNVTNVWSDAYGGGEYYTGTVTLDDETIPVKCERFYGMGVGSKWVVRLDNLEFNERENKK